MKKHTKADVEKDNRGYLETNPVAQRSKALKALEKAKQLEEKQIAAGKKWVVSPDGKTAYLV